MTAAKCAIDHEQSSFVMSDFLKRMILETADLSLTYQSHLVHLVVIMSWCESLEGRFLKKNSGHVNGNNSRKIGTPHFASGGCTLSPVGGNCMQSSMLPSGIKGTYGTPAGSMTLA